MAKHLKIGIIGGLSPESTVSYYLHITRTYFKRYGSHDYPEIIVYSVSLEQYHLWREQNCWDLIAQDLGRAANQLQNAGADFGVIATNTMHKVFNEVTCLTSLPLLSIIEATAKLATHKKFQTLGLLGTFHTMSENFYKLGLAEADLDVIVPSHEEQKTVHRIIVDELVCGILLETSKSSYLKIIDRLKSQGAEAIILGCTEIPLLINPSECDIPLLDTAKIHALAALEYSLTNGLD